MDVSIIRHRPRHIEQTVLRRFEYETDCPDCPEGLPHLVTKCPDPDCDCVMVYRGIGRLYNGTRVHHFECVHSPKEVISVSIVCSE